MSNQPLDRKDLILDSLHSHLRKRTRQRRAMRVGSAALTLALICTAVYFAAPAKPPKPAETTISRNNTPTPAPSPDKPIEVAHSSDAPDPSPAPASTSRVVVQIASSDPLPIAPCENAAAATVCILSDDQLIAALAEAGQPSGLIRTGGEAYVVPRTGRDPVN